MLLTSPIVYKITFEYFNILKDRNIHKLAKVFFIMKTCFYFFRIKIKSDKGQEGLSIYQ